MSQRELFTDREWRTLQFAVLDVFTMVSKIEGPEGMDRQEKQAFVDLLENPERIRNRVLRDVLVSLESEFETVVDAYKAQGRFEPDYFEKAFRNVGALADDKLGILGAMEFKIALSVVLGGYLAHASMDGGDDGDRVSEAETTAIEVIARWLGAASGA